jgi:hypothetical protein
MPYSSLPIPNIPSTRIIDTDTYIYIAPPNHPAGKTGSSIGWTGLTFGNDSTGDGTLAKPYATLRKAWQAAQGYIIQGNGRLFVQFQKGIYGYTFDPANRNSTNPFPDNLYHPQGDRITIQGDPQALKQRYLYRVSNYSWDLSRATYFGHTGTVNLWRAQHAYGDTAGSYPTGNGNTAHGFTGEDVFGYVTITNAAQSVPLNRSYIDPFNGVHTNGKYSSAANDDVGYNWFRSQLNHGLSYEEATAVCGIARIEGATSSPFDLALQFRNFNLDGRVVAHNTVQATVDGKLNGGIANGLSFGGGGAPTNMIPGNYPEAQYGQPNGFYGPTFGVGLYGNTIQPSWENNFAVAYGTGPGVNLSYPARIGSEVHITDDPHILTNYPVVIKVYSQSAQTVPNLQKPVPLFLDGCRLHSVRNLMFVNGDVEGRSRTVAPQGGTLAPCAGFDHDYSVNSQLETYRGTAPQCLLMRDRSVLGIRHLGMVGWGLGADSGVLASVMVGDGSQLYIDPCVDTTDRYSNYSATSSGAPDVRAELGSLTNTPLLNIHGGGVAIEGAGTVVDFFNMENNSYARPPKGLAYTQCPSWIQSLSSVAVACSHGPQVHLGPTTIGVYYQYPGKFTMQLNLPVIPGGTVFGGVSAQFLHPSVFEDANGRGVTYTSVVGYARSSSGLLPFARFFVTGLNGSTFPHANPSGTGRTGWGNSGVVWSASNNSGAVTLPTGFSAAVQNQPLVMHGINLYDHSLDSTPSLLRGLCSGGITLEFYAYHDQAEGVTVANQFFALNRNSAVIRTPSGVTITATDTTGNAGYTYAFAGPITNPVQMYEYNNSGYGLYVYSASVFLGGNLTVCGKSHLPVFAMHTQSAMYCLSSHISLQGGAHSQFLLNSSASFEARGGAILLKNPGLFGIGNNSQQIGGGDYGYGLMIRHGGNMKMWGPLVSIGKPFSRFGLTNYAGYIGLYSYAGVTSPRLIGTAYAPTGIPDGAPILIYGSGKLSLSSVGYYPAIFCWDGGADAESIVPTGSTGHRIGGMQDPGCELYGNTSVFHVWNTTQGLGSGANTGFVKLMTRGAYGTNALQANGQQLLYNVPRGNSMWFVGVGKDTTGTSGWIGPRSGGLPSDGNRNLAYLDRVYWQSGSGRNSYGAAVFTYQDVQRAAGATADPPGYSGPGFFVATDVSVNTINYGEI